MKFKVIGLTLAALVMGSLTGQAATISSLGSLGPPGVATFGNSFSTAGNFADIYTFNVAAPADVFGVVLKVDFSPGLNINIASTQLFSGDPLGSSSLVAANAGCTSVVCSWDVTNAGSYFVEIMGSVTNVLRIAQLQVGYGGVLGSLADVSQTPVPAALPLFATGLGALGLFGWWRKRKTRSIVAA